ncbi:MAG: transglutaminase-like domain-containing protein [Bacteroidales bacterium]
MEKANTNTELEALISLLDEPDNHIFVQVRDKIFSYGTDAIPVLEDAWDQSTDNRIQQRIEGIIHNIQFENVYEQLKGWKLKGGEDLLKGFILVAKYQYPDLKEKEIIDKIGQIIQDVWLELNNNLTPLEKVKVINHIFFDVHGFKGNKSDIHAPQNSFINIIFETKRANPISLSIIYMVVAQSLKIPVYGINLPQNFIMAYLNRMIEPGVEINRNSVQFYINAFTNGAVFTRREVELFLRQINLEQEDKYFLPCDNITVIRRVINNLIFSYANSGDTDKSEELKRLQKALD